MEEKRREREKRKRREKGRRGSDGGIRGQIRGKGFVSQLTHHVVSVTASRDLFCARSQTQKARRNQGIGRHSSGRGSRKGQLTDTTGTVTYGPPSPAGRDGAGIFA